MLAEQHQRTGQTTECACGREREDHRLRIGDAGALGRDGIEADHTQPKSQNRSRQDHANDDGEHQGQRKPGVDRKGIVAGQQRKLGRFRNFEGLREGRRTRHRLAQQQGRLHGPIEQPDADEGQQQCRDHLVGAGLHLQHRGEPAPQRAGDNSRERRQDEGQSQRKAADMAVERHRGGRDAADGDLPLAADIGQVGTVCEHEAEPDQCEHRAAVERRREREG